MILGPANGIAVDLGPYQLVPAKIVNRDGAG
jgi:hypothetical protein